MSKIKTLVELFKHDRKGIRKAIVSNFTKSTFSHIVPDKLMLKMQYRAYLNKRLNFKNPITFNEKLQWLKLYHRKPIFSILVDKYRVKNHVAKIIGDKYLIPTIGVWDNFEDIDFYSLPDNFVLKCTHDSGSVIICRDKATFDFEKAKKKLKNGLMHNLFWHAREWPYKNVERKIIAEKYMTDDSGGLIDYKFFCFNGYVDCVMVCIDRHLNDPKFYFFDKDWNLLRLNIRGINAPSDFTLRKPECMDEMFKIAAKLSTGFPFVRIDLFECNNQVYFGEYTFFPDAGFDANLLPETDEYFGKLIDLGVVYKNENNRISN